MFRPTLPKRTAYLYEDLDAEFHEEVFRVIKGVKVKAAQALFSVGEIILHFWILSSYISLRKTLSTAKKVD